jgi:hypothetical protein
MEYLSMVEWREDCYQFNGASCRNRTNSTPEYETGAAPFPHMKQ